MFYADADGEILFPQRNSAGQKHFKGISGAVPHGEDERGNFNRLRRPFPMRQLCPRDFSIPHDNIRQSGIEQDGSAGSFDKKSAYSLRRF